MVGIWNRVPDLVETVARIEKATTADIRAFGKQLCQGNSALALYGPADDAPSLATLQERLAA
jgi:hypothetical protein